MREIERPGSPKAAAERGGKAQGATCAPSPDGPTRVIRGWLFDLDDTLVSSARVWRIAEEELHARLGSHFDPVLAESYRGLNAEGVAKAIHASIESSSIGADACVSFLRSRLIDLARTRSEEIEGATELLRRASVDHRLAVASGSPREVIETVVDRFRWRGYFEVLVSSEEVPAGKPAPDVYLETARRLGLLPDECLVVEDSLHGVHAALAAGMRCLAVPSVSDPTEITRLAHRSFGSHAEIDPSSCD